MTPFLVGVISGGDGKGCAHPEGAGFLVNLYEELTWIRNTIGSLFIVYIYDYFSCYMTAKHRLNNYTIKFRWPTSTEEQQALCVIMYIFHC